MYYLTINMEYITFLSVLISALYGVKAQFGDQTILNILENTQGLQTVSSHCCLPVILNIAKYLWTPLLNLVLKLLLTSKVMPISWLLPKESWRKVVSGSEFRIGHMSKEQAFFQFRKQEYRFLLRKPGVC